MRKVILDTVAVAKGAAVPSVQAARPHADFVHGADGIGNIYPGSTPGNPARTAIELSDDAQHSSLHALDAADFIIQSARDNPGEITLVAVGPLTNIAEALRREPKLPEMVAGLVIMGGTVEEPGNVSPVAEANFLNDPHAADALFAVEWPATAAKEAADKGAEPQCAMHDAAAIAYVVLPEAFTVSSGRARVVHDGIAIGQFAIDRKGYAYAVPHWENRPFTNACMQVDAQRVRDDFLQTIINNHTR